MNHNLKWTIICATSFLVALLFFACRNEYIILNFRSLTNKSHAIAPKKKNINLFYWTHERWNKEEVEVIWTSNLQNNIATMVKSWLILIEEEKLIDKKITLLSALVAANQNELYISLDRNPFDDDQSTIKKLMLVESLLKTLRENKVPIKKVRLLKHHQTIWDHHLDFYHPWPIEGFLTN